MLAVGKHGGYPYDPDGGAGKIRTTGQVYTSTGNAYHLAYPCIMNENLEIQRYY